MNHIKNPPPGVASARAAAAAAEETADLASRRHAGQRCHLTAQLVASVLPGASALVFERDEDTITAETIITLVNVRASDGTLLWYDPECGFAAHPHARALGTPAGLDSAVLADIREQLQAAYDASPCYFDSSGDGAVVMPGANLLTLLIPGLVVSSPGRTGQQVVIQAPGGAEHRFSLAGEDTLLVLVEGQPVLGVDETGPGCWYGETWQRLCPAGELVERVVSIEAITTEEMWRDLEAALRLRPHELGRFKPWTAGEAKHLAGSRYDLDAAAAWARRNGLAYEDERRVRVPAPG